MLEPLLLLQNTLCSMEDVLHWSKPGGDTYLYSPLEMLAGAQRCLSEMFRCSWLSAVSLRWDLGSAVGRELGLLMISHVMGLGAPPILQFLCFS